MVAKRDIFKGCKMDPEDFEFLTDHKPVLGALTLHCGETYVDPKTGMPRMIGMPDRKVQDPEPPDSNTPSPEGVSHVIPDSVAQDSNEVQNG